MSAAELAELLVSSTSGVAFTGAGISTESGIPDFRSPGGVWSKVLPIEFSDFVRSEEMRRESWRRKLTFDETMTVAEPNAGHNAIAELVEQGRLAAVVTQNIDGLHQKSGVPPNQIIELHGNATYATCLHCARRYELDDILREFKKDETLPICDACGGIVKTATISFGQSMPELPMRRAKEVSLACDLFLAIGSSLVVFPAAGFPALAKEAGSRLVIINREPTELDPLADLVIRAEIGAVMSEAVALTRS